MFHSSLATTLLFSVLLHNNNRVEANNCSSAGTNYYFDYVENDGSYGAYSDLVCIICNCNNPTNSTSQCREYRKTSLGIRYVNAYCNLTCTANDIWRFNASSLENQCDCPTSCDSPYNETIGTTTTLSPYNRSEITDDATTNGDISTTTTYLPHNDDIRWMNDTTYDINNEPSNKESLLIQFTIECRYIIYRRSYLFNIFRHSFIQLLLSSSYNLDNNTIYIENFEWNRVTPTTPAPSIPNNDVDQTTQSPMMMTTTAATSEPNTGDAMASTIATTNRLTDIAESTTYDFNATIYETNAPTVVPTVKPTNAPTLNSGRREIGNGKRRLIEDGRGTEEPMTTMGIYNYDIFVEMAIFFDNNIDLNDYFDQLVDSSNLRLLRSEYATYLRTLGKNYNNGDGFGSLHVDSMTLYTRDTDGNIVSSSVDYVDPMSSSTTTTTMMTDVNSTAQTTNGESGNDAMRLNLAYHGFISIGILLIGAMLYF